jgi:hypothetical protein
MKKALFMFSFFLSTFVITQADSLPRIQDTNINGVEHTQSISANSGQVDRGEFLEFVYIVKAVITDKIFNSPESNASSKQQVLNSHVYVLSFLMALFKFVYV